MLASHKVLLPYVRNEGEVLEMLREQNGAKSEEGIRCLFLKRMLQIGPRTSAKLFCGAGHVWIVDAHEDGVLGAPAHAPGKGR